jgi:uncharacterized phage-like protein YoqJ
MIKIAITGHRPDKLPGGYKECEKLLVPFFQERFMEAFEENAQVEVYIGGALGIDQIAMQALLDVPLSTIGDNRFLRPILCEPFQYFWAKWPPAQIEKYLYWKAILDQTKIITVCEGGYAPYKMQKRNEYMVDHSDVVWAWWDGTEGGTANCIEYAEQQGKEIRNLLHEWHE